MWAIKSWLNLSLGSMRMFSEIWSCLTKLDLFEAGTPFLIFTYSHPVCWYRVCNSLRCRESLWLSGIGNIYLWPWGNLVLAMILFLGLNYCMPLPPVHTNDSQNIFHYIEARGKAAFHFVNRTPCCFCTSVPDNWRDDPRGYNTKTLSLCWWSFFVYC